MTSTESASARVRAQLDHPVIDCDGHIFEMSSTIADYIGEVGGAEMADRYRARKTGPIGDVIHGDALAMPLDQRADAWVPKNSWWNQTTNTLDRATAMLPKLLAERMDEFGIDFMMPYPTEGLLFTSTPEEELRQVFCRAYNTYTADLLAPYADRMTPVAVIPMETPQEAIAELRHAVRELGFKAAVFQESAGRPIPRVARDFPGADAWIDRADLFGLDSAYDYDPVWAACVELGVAVTFHGHGTAKPLRGSISNHLFNRQFFGLSWRHRVSCAAMFYGGVSRRFPTLNIGWLEGGVGWACEMLGQLVGHWDKRGAHAIEALNPNNLDRSLLYKLIDEYGDDRSRAGLAEVRAQYDRDFPRPPIVDEFAACEIHTVEELVELFTKNFYFGCEGDDLTLSWAFRSESLPLGSTLKVLYGSDIAHWDVPHMNEVLEEAYEGVEHGLMTTDQFRELMFVNPVRFHAGTNPHFFKGTRVEGAVDALLSSPSFAGSAAAG